MNYQESIKLIESYWKFGIKLGLDRISFILSEIGMPQNSFKSIHVAGTNGKGSICAMMSSVLKEAGYNVGTYTSPHLVDYTERIAINGINISKDDFAAIISELIPAIDKCARSLDPPTEFEILTAACFYYFAKNKIDIAVVEVGLGGRFDATNVLLPIVCIIAEISRDHTDVLGFTIDSIASEKCGIIKNQIPVVALNLNPDAADVILETTKKENAPLTFITYENIQKTEDIYDKSDLTLPAGVDTWIKTKERVYKVYVPLLGRVQALNAALVISAAEILNKKSFIVSIKNLEDGLANTKMHGRFEVVHRDPMIIVDGAHNVSAAKSLAENLNRIKKHGRINIIIGMLSTKDAEGFVNELSGVADNFIVTRSTHPKSLSTDYLASEVQKTRVPFETTESIDEVLEIIPERNITNFYCITGSFATIGEFVAKMNM